MRYPFYPDDDLAHAAGNSLWRASGMPSVPANDILSCLSLTLSSVQQATHYRQLKKGAVSFHETH